MEILGLGNLPSPWFATPREKLALNMLRANCFFAKLAKFNGNLIDRAQDRKEKFSVENWPWGGERA